MSYTTSRSSSLDPSHFTRYQEFQHPTHIDVHDLDLNGPTAWTRAGALLNWATIVAAFALMTIGLHFIVDALTALFSTTQGTVFREGLGPFTGLAAGILATALLQSSSAVTVSLVYGVGTGMLSTEAAISAIFGANIATTMSPLFLTFWLGRDRERAERAQRMAFMHVWFNILGVAVFLPLELAFHPLETVAHRLVAPVNDLVQSEDVLQGISRHYWGNSYSTGSGMMWLEFVGGSVLAVAAVVLLQHRIKALIGGTGFAILERAGGITDVAGLTLGVLATMASGYSSATVTAVAGAASVKAMRDRAALPVIMGANIGTTLTGILIAFQLDFSAGSVALRVALVHLLFNLTGTLIVLLVPFARRCIIALATWSASAFRRSYAAGLVIMALIGWAIPLLVLNLFR